MFQINSTTNPEVIWQYIAMILITIALGYMIGYAGSAQTKKQLEAKLLKLNSDLENCRSKKEFLYNKSAEHDIQPPGDQRDLPA